MKLPLAITARIHVLFKNLLLCIALVGLNTISYAQYSLIKHDIDNQGGSGAIGFTSFKGKTYFIANDGAHGFELFWSDGQSYGLVADLYPGPANGFHPIYVICGTPCVLGSRLYFPARDDSHGVSIWEYDRINPPTMAVALDSTCELRGQLTALNGSLYYQACVYTSGGETKIYRYNPLTKMSVPINTTVESDINVPMVAFKDKLLFKGFPGGGGSAGIYEYDPLTDAVRMIEMEPGSQYVSPVSFYVYGNILYFGANTDLYGSELYRYDGFSVPQRITDVISGKSGSVGSAKLSKSMVMYHNKLHFMAMTSVNDFNLYNYDPVTGAVQMVKEINSPKGSQGMEVYGGKLYIAMENDLGQRGLFIYDGNDLRHISSLGFDMNDIPRYLTESNGRLYFQGAESIGATTYEASVFTDQVALGVHDAGEEFGNTAVYPNPATTEATISFTLKQTAKLNVQLADMQGRVVYTATEQYSVGKCEVLVPARELAAGVYMYAVTNADGVVLGRGKVVKQ